VLLSPPQARSTIDVEEIRDEMRSPSLKKPWDVKQSYPKGDRYFG
jgi:hypothetical protein